MQATKQEPNWFKGNYGWYWTKCSGASDIYSLQGRPWIAVCSIFRTDGTCVFNHHQTFQSEDEARDYARKFVAVSHDYNWIRGRAGY